jgi:hypothetical protein
MFKTLRRLVSGDNQERVFNVLHLLSFYILGDPMGK